MFISPRYLANIENKGQHPSLQIFFELIQRYHISVDQFLLETPPEKNTQRRQLDALLDGMSDTGIRIVTASKKRPSKLPEEWEVIPDTHEGIVTQEEFDTVQQLMTSRRREQNAGGFENIFSGVIKCADCGYAMRAASANRRKRPDIIDCVQYTCNNYGRYGNVMCTAHSIEARDLFNAVLADINRFADMAVNDEKAVRAIERRLTETDQSRAKSLEKEKKKLNKRLAELDRLFSSLYEDKVMERITERNFEMMSGKYQKEQLEIEARLKEVTETLNDSYEKSQGVRDFLSLIRNYQGLKELDATIINALIDKILVSEREKLADGTVRQEIKIYYKFIGFVGELHITPTKRWTALKPKNCTVCGVEYVPSSGISKYCPACAKRIQREKSNESKRRSRERNRRACIELSAKNDRLILVAVAGERLDAHRAAGRDEVGRRRVAGLHGEHRLRLHPGHGAGGRIGGFRLLALRAQQRLRLGGERLMLALAACEPPLQRPVRAVFQHVVQRADGHIGPRRALGQQVQRVFVHLAAPPFRLCNYCVPKAEKI